MPPSIFFHHSGLFVPIHNIKITPYDDDSCSFDVVGVHLLMRESDAVVNIGKLDTE